MYCLLQQLTAFTYFMYGNMETTIRPIPNVNIQKVARPGGMQQQKLTICLMRHFARAWTAAGTAGVGRAADTFLRFCFLSIFLLLITLSTPIIFSFKCFVQKIKDPNANI